MPLTATAIWNVKPAEKPSRLFDEQGLCLEIAPSGGRWWRLEHRIDGKEKRVSLGVYPNVGLKESREARDAARKLVAQEIDPSAHRRAQKVSRLEKRGQQSRSGSR